MKLGKSYAKTLRADYVAFLKEAGIEEEHAFDHPAIVGASLAKVSRKHAPDHESDMFGFTSLFGRVFKLETSLIRKGLTGGKN